MPTDLLILLALFAAAALLFRARYRREQAPEPLIRLSPRAADRHADPRTASRAALIALALTPLLLLTLVVGATQGEPTCELPRPGKACQPGEASSPAPALLLLAALAALLFAQQGLTPASAPASSDGSSPRSPKSSRDLSLFLLLLPLVTACAPAPGPHLEPSALDFTPERSQHTFYVVNPGPKPLQLRELRLDTRTPDWGSFVIQERSIPPTVPAGGELALRIAVDPENFRDPSAPRERRYRAGASRLLLDLDGAPQRLPLRFASATAPALVERLTKLSALLLLLLALFAARRRLRLSALPLPFVLALALFPFADALCPSELAAWRSTRDLARCAEGHGGAALQLLHLDGALMLWLAALLLDPLARLAAAPRAASPATAQRLLLRRQAAALVLVLAAIAALLGHSALDPRALMLAQHPPLIGPLPRWGLFLQPLAAAAFLWAAAGRRPPGRPTDGADRLDDLAVAALFVTLFAGGWQLPFTPPPRLPHALDLLLQLGVSLSKIALVDRLHSWLRARLRPQQLGPPFLLALLALLAALFLKEPS